MQRLLPLFLLALPLFSQTADSAARLKWWTDARFGMFIHWGIYSVPAGQWQGHPSAGLGEWIMFRSRIPVMEYEQFARQFNPEKFDAEAWVSLAKSAGMKYITITAKHHDGFAMFKSGASPYNIVDATPFHRDVLKELSAACQRVGIKLCFYYSQTQDWHEPDAVGNDWDFPDQSRKNFQKYYDEKVLPQVRELLTNYGPVGLIWFDTPRNITREQSRQLADLVHQLQPQCLVSGRVGNGFGDYDSVGDNQISVALKRPWETPVTMNDTWGFRQDDHNWKSAQVLIRQLALTASRGGNYLLNVGPTSEGVIPSESVERLKQIGEWTKVNGESIYGTSADPFPYDFPWGVITAKPGKLYLHIFEWPEGKFVLYGLESKVRHASLLASHAPIPVKQKTRADGFSTLELSLPQEAPDQNDSVIELDTAGDVTVDFSLRQQPDGVIRLTPALGDFHKGPASEARLDSRGVAERWTQTSDWMEWTFKVNRPSAFDVQLITSQQKYGSGWEGGQRVAVEAGSRKISGVIRDDGRLDNPANPYWPYVISKIGEMSLTSPGSYTLALKPEEIPAGQQFGLTLVELRLIPHEQKSVARR